MLKFNCKNCGQKIIKRLVHRPDWKPENWRKAKHTRSRVPCMTIYQGKLYAGTGNCFGRCEPNLPEELGRIFCMEAGKNISLDDDLGCEWSHLVFVREKDCLKLYVNGALKVMSDTFDPEKYNISNKRPLLIGFGRVNYFNGAIDDVRVYHGAINSNPVKTLFNLRQ